MRSNPRNEARRTAALAGLTTIGVLAVPWRLAAAQAAFSQAEAGAGLREALERGAGAAVSRLGARDGFFKNPKVRIPLPGFLEDAAGIAKLLGMGPEFDELSVAMNRAAEAAVPRARELLVQAVRSMTVGDAVRIVRGGETSVTEFFAAKTREPLFVQFLPVVREATQRVGLARRYNDLVAKLRVGGDDARVEHHVTEKTLDGLYYMIGQEEIAIRRNPLGYGSDILGKVFGAL